MTADSRGDIEDEIANRPVILLVEDEDTLRETTSEYLRLSGYAVLEAASAADALAAFVAGKRVDAVFSDIHLPGGMMEGLRLALWVRRHHRGVPVMLTSGQGEAIRLAALVGEQSFAVKPYRQKEVVDRLRSLLDERLDR
jgi:CheY-like chemotaxis protein